MAALRARNHEVVLADLPALLGAARLYLTLVRAEKTRRTTRRANALARRVTHWFPFVG